MTPQSPLDEAAVGALAASLPVGIVVHGATSGVRFANAKALELLGLTEDQLRGRSALDGSWNVIREDGSVFAGEEHPSVVAGRTGRPVRDVVMGVHRPRTDDRAWLLVSAEPFQDAEGRIHHVVVTFTDVTSRKRAEDERALALRAAERFRRALDEVPAYVYMKDRQSRYTYANARTLELFGVSAAELPGSDDTRFFPPETVQRLREVDARVFGGERTHEEVVVTPPDGTVRTYLEVKTPLTGDGDEPTELLGISIDVSEERRKELRSSRLSAFYAALARCYEAIAMSASEQELYVAVCRAAVEVAGVPMAWIGLEDPATRRIVPIASVGDTQGYLDTITISTDPDDPRSHGPTGTAFREAEPVWVEDFQADARTAVWREQAKRSGWVSSAAVPVFRRGRVVGALTMYATDVRPFDPEVRRLLGDLARGIGLGLDRVEAVAELRASHEEYELFFEGMVSGVMLSEVVTDASGTAVDHRYLRVNPAFERITGVASKDLIGQLASVLPLGTPPELRLRYYAVAATGVPIQYERYNAKFDRYFEVRVVSPKRGQFAVSFTDVTERRRAEARLRLEGAALAAAANAIVITDRHARIESVNSAFTAMTGYAAEEAIGRTFKDLITSGTHDRALYANLWDTILAGRVWRGELVNRRKDGRLYTEESTITPVRDERGEISHFVAVKQDVTERRALEEQFRQAQKMESVGRLAGGVAHDFNNMLSVILGRAELALTMVDASSPVQEDLKEIMAAGRRSADLTRQLLTFARKQDVSPRAIDLGDEVTTSLKLLKRLISEEITLRSELAPALWSVYVDPTQVDQILANLCVNARDAITSARAGGRAPGPPDSVTIRTANRTLDAAFCAEHGEAAPGEYVQLSVRDSGCGMSADVQGRIFEPFFTTKAPGEGTGLGLSMVFGAVRQNNGFIVVTSAPGAGATFDIFLPRHMAQAAPAEVAASEPLTRGSGTILVVEDDSAVLQLTASTLRRLGYTVLAAGSPRSALGIAADHRGGIDLVLTDVIMPGMNGRELADALEKRIPGMRRLYMSGYTSEVLEGRTDPADEARLLRKPFTLASLARKVREALHRT